MKINIRATLIHVSFAILFLITGFILSIALFGVDYAHANAPDSNVLEDYPKQPLSCQEFSQITSIIAGARDAGVEKDNAKRVFHESPNFKRLVRLDDMLRIYQLIDMVYGSVSMRDSISQAVLEECTQQRETGRKSRSV